MVGRWMISSSLHPDPVRFCAPREKLGGWTKMSCAPAYFFLYRCKHPTYVSPPTASTFKDASKANRPSPKAKYFM